MARSFQTPCFLGCNLLFSLKSKDKTYTSIYRIETLLLQGVFKLIILKNSCWLMTIPCRGGGKIGAGIRRCLLASLNGISWGGETLVPVWLTDLLPLTWIGFPKQHDSIWLTIFSCDIWSNCSRLDEFIGSLQQFGFMRCLSFSSQLKMLLV